MTTAAQPVPTVVGATYTIGGLAVIAIRRLNEADDNNMADASLS